VWYDGPGATRLTALIRISVILIPTLGFGSKDVPTVILSFNQDGSLTEEEIPLIHNLQILDSDEAQLNFLEGKYRTSFKSTISCLFVYKHLCLL
jgi:hypothetical protein